MLRNCYILKVKITKPVKTAKLASPLMFIFFINIVVQINTMPISRYGLNSLNLYFASSPISAKYNLK